MASDQRPTTNDCLLYYITDRTAFAADEPTRRRRLLEKIAEAARAGVDYIQLREKDLPARELESLARDVAGIMRDLRTGQEAAPQGVKPASLLTSHGAAGSRALPESVDSNLDEGACPKLLINSRVDVALAAGADGVHLRSDDILPEDVRQIWESAFVPPTLRKPRRVGQPEFIKEVGQPGQCGAGTHARENLPRPLLIGVSCHSPIEVAQAAADGADFAVFAPVFEKKDSPRTPPTGLVDLEHACRANIQVLALGGVTLENARPCIEAGAAGIAGIRLFQENDVAEVVQRLRKTAP